MEIVLAKSKAGHDKHHIYVIAGGEGDMVYLVNGTTRPMSRPKKKKRIHIWPIVNLPPEVAEAAGRMDSIDDASVQQLIALYNRRSLKCQRQTSLKSREG